MNDTKNSGDTTLTVAPSKTLHLKRPVEQGSSVRQSFSHGRTKAVLVEKVKRRAPGPGEATSAGSAPAAAPTTLRAPIALSPVAPRGPTTAASAAQPAPARPTIGLGASPPKTGVVLHTLTEEQREARAKALVGARAREEEDRRRQEADAKVRTERDARERQEREAADTRKRDEDIRRTQEAEVKRRAEEEARRRLAGGEPTSAPTATAVRKPVVPGAVAAAPIGRAVVAEDDSGPRLIRRPAQIPAKVVLPVRTPKGAEQRNRGRLTVTSATAGEDERTRSVAAFRRRVQRLKGQGFNEPREKLSREIVLPERISIQELANRMSERAVDVIKFLMRQGQMATITDVLDADTAQLVAEELGHKVKRVAESDVEEGLFDRPDEDGAMVSRPPVVTIMGHVDHGKTSLLDAIRKANVVAGEAGGITQHIGAYQVTAPSGSKITFIDTPGHAAFTAMRARGAMVTDIVVLVVAADDGVMPQTIEAIRHARAAKAPIIVAINKIDKPDANPERVSSELLQHDVQVEAFGGDTLAVEVSATKHTNLDKLLEAIALQAELLDLKADPERSAEGTVIEARLDRGRGPVATVLVQRGTLRVGELVVAGSQWGRVRALIDDQGGVVDEAGPSTPVEVLGFSGAPEAGDRVAVVENEARAREITEYRDRLTRD
jgi:translation initiation factor IF-2